MVMNESIIRDALRDVPDPEMPISIVDLGLVEKIVIDGAHATITLLPTFVGCPALDMIADDVKTKLHTLDGVDAVDVEYVFDPPWSVDRISDDGRRSLAAHGVTVPERGGIVRNATVSLSTSAVPCPFCRSRSTRLESPFGPTRCRMIYYCDACKNSFEHMKRVAAE